MLIQKFYSYIRVLNSQPELLADLDRQNSDRISTLLEAIMESLEEPDDQLESAIEDFLIAYEDTPLIEHVGTLPQMRGMVPKSETVYPRQILNDVTLMTLQRLGR